MMKVYVRLDGEQALEYDNVLSVNTEDKIFVDVETENEYALIPWNRIVVLTFSDDEEEITE